MPPSRNVLVMLSLVATIALPGCAQDNSPPPLAGNTVPPGDRGVPGKFDGTWQVTSAGLSLDPSAETPAGCGSIDLQFEVKGSQVGGGLKRTPYGNSVESGSGFLSAPMSGTVQQDGTVAIHWERYVVTGTMSGDKVRLRWKGECGPRNATGERVAS